MAGVMNNLFGLDDRSLMLRKVIDVSLPSACGIFRSGSSVTLQQCGRGQELDSNVANAVVPEVLILPPHCWFTAIPTASPGPLCWTRAQLEKGAPTTAVAQ